MSSNEMMTTVVGRAATAPREIHGARVPYTSFRLATAPRYYDKGRGEWVEGRTEWLTVKAFRDTALNVALSVQKGQPLVVHGRLRTEEWTGENGPRVGLVLEAAAIGHDMTRGRSTFVRTRHGVADGERPVGTDGTDGRAGAADGAADGTAGDGPADPWAVAPGADGGPDENPDDLPDEPAVPEGVPGPFDSEEPAATP